MNQENHPLYYGLKSKEQAIVLAFQVCDVLGHGRNNNAHSLLLETAAAETCLGHYKDPTPNGAGMGMCQKDKIGFDDVVARTRRTLLKVIEREFGYDLLNVSHTQLANDPLLSLIFCRLHYRLRPEIIPNDLVSRAVYWKQFYNTVAGKGTTDHYIKNAYDYLYRKTGERQWP